MYKSNMTQIISSETGRKNQGTSILNFGIKTRENGREMWLEGKLKSDWGLRNGK